MADDYSPRKPAKLPERTAKYWLKQLERENKQLKKWRERAAKIVKRYRNDRDEAAKGERRFNILWSNVETLKPAVYSRRPNPDVRKRFMDHDPIARLGAEIIERSLIFALDDYDFDCTMEKVRDDGLIAGRGQLVVEYESEIDRIPLTKNGDKYQRGGADVEPDGFDEDSETAYQDEKRAERVWCDYVPWPDFRCEPRPQWETVTWAAFAKHMARHDLKAEFPEHYEKIKLEASDDDTDRDGGKGNDKPDRATVWKIWDKLTRKIYFVSKGCDEILRESDVPFDLKGFFPCPAPFVPIATTDSPVPVPEYTIYQDQAEEVDKLTARINKLIDAIKARGAYPSALGGSFANLLEGEENQLSPVDDWETLVQLGGFDKAVMWAPIEQMVKVVQVLVQQREAAKQQIFEMTGMSDIIRGASNANETATAQKLKGNFGTLRMQPRSKPFERFARDAIRIKAEIIAEMFGVETIARITGLPERPQVKQPAPGADPQMAQQAMIDAQMAAQQSQQEFMAAIALLKDDRMRSFRVDIETDSTIAPDQEADKAATSEFVTAITAYLKAAGEIALQVPQLTPLLMDILKAAASKFKMGRQLEEAIEEASKGLAETAAQPKVDPAKAEAEAKMALEQEKMALETKKVTDGMELKRAEAENKIGLEQYKVESANALKQQEQAFEMRLQEQKAAHEAALRNQDMAMRERESANAARLQELQHNLKAMAEKFGIAKDAGIFKVEEPEPAPDEKAEKIGEAVRMLAEAIKEMRRPRKITRKDGPEGRSYEMH